MTPTEIELIETLNGLAIADPEHRKYVDALHATAKKRPAFALTDQHKAFLRDRAHDYRRELPVHLSMRPDARGWTYFQWMAPSLVKGGFIKNEPWVPDNATKAIALYKLKSLHFVAMILAAVHEYAYDYLAAAPVLAVVAANKSACAKLPERDALAMKWSARFKQGGKLRNLLEENGITYPLRKLSGQVLGTESLRIVQTLSAMGSMANGKYFEALQHGIPEDPVVQGPWLRALDQWSQHMARLHNSPLLHLHWAFHAYKDPQIRGDVVSIADYVHHLGNRFDAKMTLQQAMDGAERWHERMARMNQEAGFYNAHGYGFEEKIDCGSFPENYEFGEFSFALLRSGKDLFEEGRALKHCVGAYSNSVLKGHSRIYSMLRKDNGKHVATVEFTRQNVTMIPEPLMIHQVMEQREQTYAIGFDDYPANRPGKRYREAWHLAQAKGPCNAKPIPEKECALAIEKLRNWINHRFAIWQYCQENELGFDSYLDQVIARNNAEIGDRN